VDGKYLHMEPKMVFLGDLEGYPVILLGAPAHYEGGQGGLYAVLCIRSVILRRSLGHFGVTATASTITITITVAVAITVFVALSRGRAEHQ
jgi:hypothetical protein